MPDCFTHFVNTTTCGTKYFHTVHVVWQHMQVVVGSVIITFIANSLENLSVQKFQNQLRIDRVTALSLVFHSVEVTISHCSSR